MGAEEEEDVEARIAKKALNIMPNLPKNLTIEEKKYLLAIERGDLANVRRMLQKAKRKKILDVNCVDSLGRGALTIAIDQENLEMVELLIIMGTDTKDALLHAINVEFVEAVELLLEHEELIHKDGEPYSWQKVDMNIATFTPDITPLILAAHRNNYEILKILLDRGATVPMPHDIKCGCDECIKQSEEDSLRHSLSRLNEYKALASPSLIALSSSDPILTAFQLSWELRNLAFAEPECKSEYMELRRQCQQFAVDLLHQSRSSEELAIILNHDPESPPYTEGDHMKLARLELAIVYKQKKFVAHPNIQQLLAALWYEGVPGFRRKSTSQKLVILSSTALFFPFYCMLYMMAPNTKTGKLMRKPFMKFLIHASSYLFFLLLLILVSLRAEDIVIEFFGTNNMKDNLVERSSRQRGNPPSILEYAVLLYVTGFIYEEAQEMFSEGIRSYLKNMWNFIDFSRNSLYTAVFILRLAAFIQQRSEINYDPSTAYVRRENWNPFDPQLIAEGLFAGANIFSALKLVHLFSINPHLGPLQISLGRMVIDIVKFFFIYSLVLFAFACGLNQLLWYFSDLEKKKCYHLPNGEPDWDSAGDACMKWRRFANVFESSQSLFWASFGMVDLGSFELTGIKAYTRFWGLLMFGSYSVINVIVLLNLLIAMMSNSYAMIDEHSDTEWKFARTKLWLSYFEESCTLPPPFNIFPRPKHLLKLFGVRKKDKLKRMSTKKRNYEEKERDYRYTSVMRALVWRYVAAMHRKLEENPVTEDDVNELKSEISAMRYELLEVLQKNGMDTSSAEKKEKAILGKKMKIWERRLMKDFKVAPVTTEEDEALLFQPPPENEDSLSRFRRVAKLAVVDSNLNKWRQVVKGACVASQIGKCHRRDSFKKQQNLQKAIAEARKLADKSPVASRSVTPIHLPDITGANMINIIGDIDTSGDEASRKMMLTPSPRASEQRSPKPTKHPNITISIQPPPSKRERSKRSPPPPPPAAPSTESTDLINLDSQKNSPIAEKSHKIDSPSEELDEILRRDTGEDEIIAGIDSQLPKDQFSPTSSDEGKLGSRDSSIDSGDSLDMPSVPRPEEVMQSARYIDRSSSEDSPDDVHVESKSSRKERAPTPKEEQVPEISENQAEDKTECKVVGELSKISPIKSPPPVISISSPIKSPSPVTGISSPVRCPSPMFGRSSATVLAEIVRSEETIEEPDEPEPSEAEEQKSETVVEAKTESADIQEEMPSISEPSTSSSAEKLEQESAKPEPAERVISPPEKRVRLDVPGDRKEEEEERAGAKSPLSERNIQRVQARSPYRQPKTGWL